MSEPTPAAEAPTTEPEAAAQPATDWEAEAKKWEKRSKDNYAKLRDAETKLSEAQPLIEASKTAEQRQAEELSKWQSEAETWRKTAVGSRIEALAAAAFADPSDAVSSLDPAAYLDAGGQINDQQIQTDLAALLERKPHWRKPDGTSAGPRPPAPNPAQGTGGAPANDPAAVFGAIVRNQLGGG